MRIDKNTRILLGNTPIVKIKKGGTVIWEYNSQPVVEPEYFYIESLTDGNTVTLITYLSNTLYSSYVTPTIEYSTDKQNWTTVTFDWSTYGIKNINIPVVLNTGDKMYFRNDTGKFSRTIYDGASYNTPHITLTTDWYGSVNVGGDIRTLINYRNVDNTILEDGMFSNLFSHTYGGTTTARIVDASNLKLPFTEITPYCYQSMFYGCTSLTSAPALPATTLADSCYMYMFRNCTSLTSAPALPATTLRDDCYSIMFSGCTSLTTAPALPATTLAAGCYSNMFSGCTALTSAPALSATTLASYCYGEMFYDCTSLTTAPALPATTLKQDCYNSMFCGCSALTTAPALPATTLTSNCYNSMFKGCTALTTAPALPATTLETGCYSSMFYGCSALTTAPALPATTLANNCYQYMFQNCTSLNKVLTYANDISAFNCTDNWLYNVTSSGTLYNGGSAVYTTDSPSGIPTGWSEAAAPALSSISVSPNTFTAKSWIDKVKVNYTVVGHNSLGIDVPLGDVSTTYDIGVNTGSSSRTISETVTYDNVSTTLSIVQSANDTDEPNYFYVENVDSEAEYVIAALSKTGTVVNTDYTEQIEYSKDKITWNTFDLSQGGGAFEQIQPNEKMYFRNDNGLLSYSGNGSSYAYVYFCLANDKQFNVGGSLRTLLDYYDANAEPVKIGVFYKMFSGRSGLIDASDLRFPSTITSYGCISMFNSCTSLTSAPELPVITLASSCYSHMFDGCTSLTTAPELPATTLGNNCYQYMFNGCTSLTSAPALSATTLADSCCYHMFDGCTSLTTAPNLPATTLANYCYQYMFQGCTSLTTAPTLSATTLAQSCYSNMFNGCTALTTVTTLPATTLSSYCYSNMFNGCTALTTAPELPATTLVSGCYSNMFKGCSSLNSVTIFAQDISATSCLSTWLQNVTASGTFNNNGLAEYPSGNSGIPTGWTEVQPIQSIAANPDTFTLKSFQTNVKCESTLTITTTFGTTVTKTNSVTLTVGENTGDSTRTLTETIPYKGSSYQVTIVQTANDPIPAKSWSVSSTGTYPFELNSNNYYESTNKGVNSSYSYATLTYEGYNELVLECINYGENKYDYGIISQPDVQLSESITDDGATGSANVFKNFKQESSATPVQLTIPSDYAQHTITIKFRKDQSTASGNDSLQFKVIEPTT